MLKAKFLRMAKGGTQAIYEVQGTSSELATYVANNFKNSPEGPVFKSTPDRKPILDANGNKTPLLFTSYPMPNKNVWYPLYQVQSGPNAGSFTLDKADLQFAMLVAKSTGGDFGQELAKQQVASFLEAPVSQSMSSLLDLDSDEADEEDLTATATEETDESASTDAEFDAVETTAPKAKTSK
jgi:hypothetical protein